MDNRRPSIVERASNLIESRLSTVSLPLPQPTLSMNPQDYELLQNIGQGSSAQVYLAVYKPTGLQVGCKVIDLDMFERNQIDELRRELQIMTLSRHVNLLQVYGSFVNGHKLFIITPFLSYGSVLDIMKHSFPEGMEEIYIATILKQVLLGLEYLHGNGLIHRDIKAGNLLMNHDGSVLLADFGVSSSLTDHGSRNNSRKTFVGTPCWMAPEVMDQSGYDYKADIWSFGITAMELAKGHAPYAKYPPMKVLMLTLQNQPPSLEKTITKYKYSKTFKEMIDICLQKDPAKRSTAEKLLQHPFFKQAKKPNFLVTTILQNLKPIHDRPNQQGSQVVSDIDHEVHEEWDFDDSSVHSGQKTIQKNNEFSHDLVTKLDQVKLEQSLTTDSDPQTIIPNSMTQESSCTPSVENDAMQKSLENVGKSVSFSLESLPRKSRFVVDSAQPKQDTSSTDQPIVRKSRFSVVDQHDSNVSSVSGQSIQTADSNLERKAGRFAYSNLPTSAVTSPVLGATEGPKTGRKFTIVNDPTSTTAAPTFTTLKPRFQKVDSEVIEQALLPVPSDLNESELLEWFKKQHTLMKTLLVDLIKMNSSSTSLQDTNESQ